MNGTDREPVGHRVMGESGAETRGKMRRKEYEKELERLQVELVHLQRWTVTSTPRCASCSRDETRQERAGSSSG